MLGLAVVASPAFAAAPAASSATAGDGRRPPPLVYVATRALDDPRAALALAQGAIAAAQAGGDRDTEFWLRLGRVEVFVQTDHDAAAVDELGLARRALRPGDTRQARWLEAFERLAGPLPQDVDAFRRAQSALAAAAQADGDAALACTVSAVDAWIHQELDVTDEAWQALEASERCGAQLGDRGQRAYALGAMALLAGRIGVPTPAEVYFQRALDALEGLPARYQRAWLLDDFGWALIDAGQLERASASFDEALALGSAVADASIVARAHEGLAEVALLQRDAARTLRHAREALRHGAAAGLGARAVTAQTQVVEALALHVDGPTRAAELDQEIQRLRALADADPLPHHRVLAARSAARGLQALGRHAEAYAELERFVELSRRAERERRDRDARRLQAVYETARREAENAALRRAADEARHELAVRGERQRALLLLLAALLAAVAAGAWLARRAFVRRRRLADLALRDELTGLPNRRALVAFGEEQFALAERLQLPLAVALVDLDHFKQINDAHGHACGDRVLKAFAAAGSRVLRAPDRLGRWGGEEWLLVMPGAHASDLGAVFLRLRESLAAEMAGVLPAGRRVTFSMGVAERGPGVGSFDALLAEADRQLYRAKGQGRDAVAGATPALPAAA
ncbi:MAG: GGDEF domain-containing protein [Rubrivivax sp.]|jgi:diguanylate cyclase (GGDEF)-like protein|nr:GGDEF domain-containing protein [Rubrivivax sp.]